MAEGKNKIVVYRDWLKNFEDLTDEELGKLMRHFFKYVNDLNPVLEDRLLLVAWKPIEATLKRDLKSWESFIGKQKENGSKGGRPIKTETQKTQAFIEKPKKPDNDSVNVSDSVSVNVKEDINISSSDFEIFWDMYGKKVDKEASRKKFMKLKQSDIEKIFQTLPDYVKSTPDQKYRKNPATYLNNKSWNNEIIAKSESEQIGDFGRQELFEFIGNK